jgi:hypothetical protein
MTAGTTWGNAVSLAARVQTIAHANLLPIFPRLGRVAELANAADSKSAVLTGLWVRVPPRLPNGYVVVEEVGGFIRQPLVLALVSTKSDDW